jgi:hypothetical protein
MSDAELKELRSEVKNYVDHADKRVLKIVIAMLEADAGNEATVADLTAEEDAILTEQIAIFEKGAMQFSSWETVRGRISSNLEK